MPRTQIVSASGGVIATTRMEGSGVYTAVNGSDVLYSRTSARKQTHELPNGSAGQSYFEGNLVRHADNRGKTTGYDELKAGMRLIRHYDRMQNLIGETSIQIEGDVATMASDEATEQALRSLESALGLSCPDAQNAYDEWIDYRNECAAAEGASCKKSAMMRKKYKILADRCV